jgi:3-methyladenine DNA glycosylase AlkD
MVTITTAAAVRRELRALASKTIASHSLRFFRTGPGEYGAGDRFLGIRVPVLRKLTAHYSHLPLPVVETLLHSPWHEERLFALLLLVQAVQRADAATVARIAKLYWRNLRYVNNWDLVDSSAPYILGPWLQNGSRTPLHRLARSPDLWRRRIAMLATQYFIRLRDYTDALRIARVLLHDEEDLIHKAVGWMLREIGNRDAAIARKFLDRHAAQMPRTMLRYAIERLPRRIRLRYMKAERPVTAGRPAVSQPGIR